MNKNNVIARQTKYCKEVGNILHNEKHATNNEILVLLKKIYPKVSATTVHRVTARLAERGLIAYAPPVADGSMRYDSITESHDHFMCSHCGVLRNAMIREKIALIVEQSIDDCEISGPLLITGVCKQCSRLKR